MNWAVTVAFYTALRYVDAFFSPARASNHAQWLERVHAHPRTRPVFEGYRILYNQSILLAYYELTEVTRDEVGSLVSDRMGRLKAQLLRQ